MACPEKIRETSKAVSPTGGSLSQRGTSRLTTLAAARTAQKVAASPKSARGRTPTSLITRDGRKVATPLAHQSRRLSFPSDRRGICQEDRRATSQQALPFAAAAAPPPRTRLVYGSSPRVQA